MVDTRESCALALIGTVFGIAKLKASGAASESNPWARKEAVRAVDCLAASLSENIAESETWVTRLILNGLA